MRARSRLRSAFVLCPLLLLGLAGCRGSNCDLVEAELRTREMQLLDIRSERDNLVAHNQALQREINALRGGSPFKTSPEEASQTYPLHSLVLGRQTGGLDEDGQPGDEALQVFVEPRDGDGHTLKAPGTLTVHAFEITTEGLKKPLCSWEVSADELRRSWKSGLLSTGYSLVLPWKVWPSYDKVRVVAQFTLTDGRVFEQDKDVTVRLVPPAHRKPPPGPADGVDGPARAAAAQGGWGRRGRLADRPGAGGAVVAAAGAEIVADRGHRVPGAGADGAWSLTRKRRDTSPKRQRADPHKPEATASGPTQARSASEGAPLAGAFGLVFSAKRR